MPATLAKSRPRGTAAERDLYERDFYEWTRVQAAALRHSQPANLDWENVSEEIESLGRSDKRSIESNLGVILLHLLKWMYQSEKRKAGWKSSIAEHRARIRKLIADSPSLRSYPAEVLAEEYALARLKASDETGLREEDFPQACPFAAGEVLDPDFWPEASET